ncbi:MAG: hypothetical protein Q8830_03770, partial [Candidatus Phytoplasma australasiaticum]|nr:hypothetical protein [Candidatus Phytoplasma australasiaticum]
VKLLNKVDLPTPVCPAKIVVLFFWGDHLPLIEFAYNNSFYASIGMAPFRALCGRRCRSLVGWFGLDEMTSIGSDLVLKAMERVELVRETRDHESHIGDDWVYGMVSSRKSVIHFGKEDKLSSWYVGPYEIVERFKNVAYRLDLHSGLSFIHSVFYVSKLRGLVGDTSAIVPLKGVEVEENLFYEEVLDDILYGQVGRHRTKDQN